MVFLLEKILYQLIRPTRQSYVPSCCVTNSKWVEVTALHKLPLDRAWSWLFYCFNVHNPGFMLKEERTGEPRSELLPVSAMVVFFTFLNETQSHLLLYFKVREKQFRKGTVPDIALQSPDKRFGGRASRGKGTEWGPYWCHLLDRHFPALPWDHC